MSEYMVTEFDENQIIFLGTMSKEQLMRLCLIERQRTLQMRRRVQHYEWEQSLGVLAAGRGKAYEPAPAPTETQIEIPDDINYLVWWARMHEM